MSAVSKWSYVSPAAVTDTADDVAKAAPPAGQKNVITGAQIYNNHATAETLVVIKSGAVILFEGFLGALDNGQGGIEARFEPPLECADATACNVANITTGSSTFFNLQGEVRLSKE